MVAKNLFFPIHVIEFQSRVLPLILPFNLGRTVELLWGNGGEDGDSKGGPGVPWCVPWRTSQSWKGDGDEDGFFSLMRCHTCPGDSVDSQSARQRETTFSAAKANVLPNFFLGEVQGLSGQE